MFCRRGSRYLELTRCTQDINRICFGSFYRRPSESVLHRLVDCWQLSQPLHLRHLAIVRDTAIERTVFYYVHYSAENFAKLVAAGEASWEAVEFSKKGKAANFQIPAVDAKPQLDQYGFPLDPPKGLLKNGNASLFEGVAICRPPNYLLSSSDPLAVQLPDGRYGMTPFTMTPDMNYIGGLVAMVLLTNWHSCSFWAHQSCTGNPNAVAGLFPPSRSRSWLFEQIDLEKSGEKLSRDS